MNRKPIIIVLILTIVVTSALLVLHSKNNNNPPWRVFTERHRRQPATSTNIARIAEWMTFDYINQMFDLPPKYLQDTLQITSSKYPLLTLGQYAKEIQSNASTTLQEVRSAVRSFNPPHVNR